MSLLEASRSITADRVSWWQRLRASLRENSPLILITGIYVLTTLTVSQTYSIHPRPFGNIWAAYLGFLVPSGISLFTAFALWYLYHTRILKLRNFESIAWQRIRSDFLHPDRLMLALPIIALWPIFAMGFSYLKAVIPMIQPFYLDPLLHEWDRALHFGIDPWRLVHPLVGYTWITYLINFTYTMWFIAFQAALLLQMFATGDRKLRMQYLLTQTLAWALIGNFAATLLSSAGPCYYSLLLGGADPYAPLLAYLREMPAKLTFDVLGYDFQIPFSVLSLQDALWQSYVSGDLGLARGISAAPSMHVASTWIIWRLIWPMGRAARLSGSFFLLAIFVGSIHLGWHYALDGYLGIALAWMLWRLTGWMLNRRTVQLWLWPEGLPAPARGREAAEAA
jgi:PAP2 superfamily